MKRQFQDRGKGEDLQTSVSGPQGHRSDARPYLDLTRLSRPRRQEELQREGRQQARKDILVHDKLNELGKISEERLN